MGLLESRWEADWEGVSFTVFRNEVTRGFSLEANGRVLAEKRWSLVGVGELRAAIERDGKTVKVRVELPLAFRQPTCLLWVDGDEISVRRVK